MTEENLSTARPSQAESRQASASPPPREEPEAHEVRASSFIARLNPLNLFKKETPHRYVREGLALTEAKNFAQATVAFTKALSLDENCVGAYKGLGQMLVRKGGRHNMEQALQHFAEAVRRDPFAEEIYGITARIYDHLSRPKEATLERKKMVIVKTLSAEPDNPVANNNMGILFLRQKQVDQALEHFNRAIQANPRYDVALRNTASTYYQLARTADDSLRAQHLDKARGYVNRALEVLETVPSLLALVRILILEENYVEALEACERAQSMDAAHKDVFGLKKVILERLDRMEEAREAFNAYQTFSRAHPDGAR